MLLNAVIIIVREILEAAMLLSVLLVILEHLGLSARWLKGSIIGGTAGAIGYALAIVPISGLFDGFGQEIVNAFMQMAIYGLLGGLVVTLGARQPRSIRHSPGRIIPWIILATPCLAISREGSELIIYISSFWPEATQHASFILGIIIGSSIGISIGVLSYFALRSLSGKRLMPVAVTLLILMASGMTSQASLLLMQADWLPTQMPLWNSTAWLDETSVAGQFLYATMSYEATPTPIQAGIYLAAMGLLILLYGLVRYRARKRLPGVAPPREIAT